MQVSVQVAKAILKNYVGFRFKSLSIFLFIINGMQSFISLYLSRFLPFANFGNTFMKTSNFSYRVVLNGLEAYR